MPDEEFADFEAQDEYDFDDFDEFEDFEDDYGPVGKIVVQGAVSKNFDVIATGASVVMIVVAIFLLGVYVLGEVYDAGGGLDRSGMPTDPESPLKGFDVRQVAPPSVELILLGNDQQDIEDQPRVGDGKKSFPSAKNVTFAILNAGSNQGMTPGLIYYLYDPNDEAEEPKPIYWLVVTDQIDPNTCRADIGTPLEDTDRLPRTTSFPPRISDEGQYEADVAKRAPIDAVPRRAKPLQETIVEEAAKHPGTSRVIIQVASPAVGGTALPVPQTIRDPNPDWDVFTPVGVDFDELRRTFWAEDAERWNMVSNNFHILTSGARGRGLVAVLAPPDQQKIRLGVLRAIEKYEAKNASDK